MPKAPVFGGKLFKTEVFEGQTNLEEEFEFETASEKFENMVLLVDGKGVCKPLCQIQARSPELTIEITRMNTINKNIVLKNKFI